MKKAYVDGCAAAHALDLLGDRWTLLVVREMLLGPRRFSDIRKALPGISANVLTQRLEELEARSILVRRRLPPPASVQVYALTQWGMETEEMFKVLGRWAARSPLKPHGPMSIVSTIMSMRTMFDAGRAGDMRAVVGFVFGEEQFVAHIADGTIAIDRGDVAAADVIFTGDRDSLVAALYGGVPLDALADVLTVTGDHALAARFLRLFPLPPLAPDLMAQGDSAAA